MIDRFDHIVLTVRNIEATCAFYCRVLGMQMVTFGDGRKGLAFGASKIICMNWAGSSSPRRISRRRDRPISERLAGLARRF